MIYINAIEGTGFLASPKHVYSMTHEQSHRTEELDRAEYIVKINKKGGHVEGTRWYRDNSRESIRDETLGALIELGAVNEKAGIATTSGRPRYFLLKSFADLFNPDLIGKELENAIASWRDNNLSRSALSRVTIANRGTFTSEGVLVTFPNGETRHLATGASSDISKEVIEVFAKKFLVNPYVVWVSESGNKVHFRDDDLAKRLGLIIDPKLNLPDLIIFDVIGDRILVVFIEVVATDGAIDAARKKALLEITDHAGYDRSNVVFITAFMDRQSAGFKKTIDEVDWNTFIWFASEPGNFFILKEGVVTLSEIIDKLRIK